MVEQNISDHIQKLELKEGDVLFVDVNAIDIEALKFQKFMCRIPVVGVYVAPGNSVADHLAVARPPVE